MLIEIDIEVIDSEGDFRGLDRLLMLFENEQHEWYLIDPIEDVMSLAWPNQLSESHKNILEEIVRKAYVRSVNISKNERRARGVFCITTHGEHSLENALRILDDPLYIVVENETSDSLFLNRLFEIYPTHGKTLQKAAERFHLAYYPAGGRNETVKTLINLTKKKQAPYKPRVFVIIDSDKKYPKQPHDAPLQAIVDFCTAQNIPIHILYKREIENYLPKEVLERKCPTILTQVVEELCRLTPNQWDFFDLEKGFNDQRPKETDPLFAEFADRENMHYNNLRYGFHIKKVFVAKQELYKFVKDEEFNAKNVNLRCAHQPDKDELVNLLSRIKNNL